MLKNISIILKQSGIAALGLMAFSLVPGLAMAAGLSVDGIKSVNEYSMSFDASWKNGHKTEFSIYNPDPQKTTLWYDTDGDQFKLFMEVPIYAKNMIWSNDQSGLTSTDVAEYNEHYTSHHEDLTKSKMDYRWATHSEKVENFGQGGESHLQDAATSTYASSLTYLLGNNTCSKTKCLERDQTMSFEYLFTLAAGNAIKTAIEKNGLVYHLSSERRAGYTPPPEIPVPAAFWLFGTAIFGLIGMRRKAKLAA